MVDEAAGRPIFLFALWGIALAAAVTALASPSSVWRPALGGLTLPAFLGICVAWGAVVYGAGLLFEYSDAPSREDVVGALIGWVLVEEFLFRGALFDLIDRVRPPGGLDAAIVGTTVLFAVSHLQYNAFDFAESAGQIAYVIPTGLLFGWIRRRTGSVWPSVVLHSLANTIAIVGGG